MGAKGCKSLPSWIVGSGAVAGRNRDYRKKIAARLAAVMIGPGSIELFQEARQHEAVWMRSAVKQFSV